MLMYFGSVIFYFVFDKLKNKLKNKHFNLKEIRFSFKFKTMSRAFYVDVVMYPFCFR